MRQMERYEKLFKTAEENLTSFFFESSDYLTCLQPLVKLLGWTGDTRTITEKFPHFSITLTKQSFLKVMEQLNFRYRSFTARIDAIDPRLMPCMIITGNDIPLLVLEKTKSGIIIFDSTEKKVMLAPNSKIKGEVFLFHALEETEKELQLKERSWFSRILYQHRTLLWQVLWMSLLSGILSLAVPIFIMAVYDRVVTTESISMLSSFVFGLAIALFGMWVLSILRIKMLARIGKSLDGTFGESIFDRIINLPISYTESVTMGMQLAKIRSLDSVRELFTGPMANIILEIPTALVFLVAIAVLAGNLVVIPIVMMGLLLILTFFTRDMITRAVRRTSTYASNKQAFLIEALDKHSMIKYTASEAVWYERFKNVTAKHAIANYQSTVLSQGLGNLSNMIMLLAGIAVISFGAYKVINGMMTAGALFATMMIVWRALSPIRLCFTSLCQLSQARDSINQVNQLMRLPSESEDETVTKHELQEGRVQFSRISHRYPNAMEPCLLSVNFSVNDKEFTMIYGQSYSGKSTLMRLFLRLYPIQSGNIYLGGKDIRQFSPKFLRQNIAYVPQNPQIFYGTIAQNFRLANPIATDENIEQACKLVGIYDDIMHFKQGFDTRFGDQKTGSLPLTFLQRFSLARALVKKSRVLLLDEPTNGLDMKASKKLFSILEKLKGKITIIMLTHDIRQLQHADRVVCLAGGQVTYDGAPSNLQSQMVGELQ